MNREWSDIKYRNVLTELSRAKNDIAQLGYSLSKIMIHPTLIARGYLFIVEHQEQFYALVNSYDLDSALSSMPTKETEEKYYQIIGLPATKDENEIMSAMSGFFYQIREVR